MYHIKYGHSNRGHHGVSPVPVKYGVIHRHWPGVCKQNMVHHCPNNTLYLLITSINLTRSFKYTSCQSYCQLLYSVYRPLFVCIRLQYCEQFSLWPKNSLVSNPPLSLTLRVTWPWPNITQYTTGFIFHSQGAIKVKVTPATEYCQFRCVWRFVTWQLVRQECVTWERSRAISKVTLTISTLSAWGSTSDGSIWRLKSSDSDVYRRQNLTSKVVRFWRLTSLKQVQKL